MRWIAGDRRIARRRIGSTRHTRVRLSRDGRRVIAWRVGVAGRNARLLRSIVGRRVAGHRRHRHGWGRRCCRLRRWSRLSCKSWCRRGLDSGRIGRLRFVLCRSNSHVQNFVEQTQIAVSESLTPVHLAVVIVLLIQRPDGHLLRSFIPLHGQYEQLAWLVGLEGQFNQTATSSLRFLELVLDLKHARGLAFDVETEAVYVFFAVFWLQHNMRREMVNKNISRKYVPRCTKSHFKRRLSLPGPSTISSRTVEPLPIAELTDSFVG